VDRLKGNALAGAAVEFASVSILYKFAITNDVSLAAH
jgi:hypothetical protein